MGISNQEGFDNWKNRMTELIAKTTEEMAKLAPEDQKDHQKVIDEMTAEIERADTIWAEKRTEMSESLLEGYTAAINALPSLIENNEDGRNNDLIKYYQDKIKTYYKNMGLLEETVVNAFDEIIPNQNTFEKLIGADLIDPAGDVDEKMLKQILGSEGFESLKISSETLGLSMKDLVEQLQS